MISTEFDFVLPRGYVDEEGTIHREGKMRLASAADEILPSKDPRVQANVDYLVIIIMSRVVTRLGTVPFINTKVIEGLFSTDLAYLQALYDRINGYGGQQKKVICPHCKTGFDAEIGPDEE